MSYYKGIEFLTEKIGGRVRFYITINDERVYFSTTTALVDYINGLPRKSWLSRERTLGQ